MSALPVLATDLGEVGSDPSATAAVRAPLKPVLRYPGGKARLAPWIASLLPPHECYVEPYAGGASVLFCKRRALVEVLNDLDGRLVNFFAVLRDRPDELVRAVGLTPYARAEYEAADEPADDPVEDARRYAARVWMAHAGKLGSTSGWRNGWDGPTGKPFGSPARTWARLPDRLADAAERLRGVLVERRPALELIAAWAKPQAVLYADPPYVPSTLVSGDGRPGAEDWARYYRHTMTEADHAELLDVLDAHPGPVLLSGYRSALYDERLAGWTRLDRRSRAYRNAQRTESLWLNRVAAATARQPALFEVEP